MKDTTVCIIFQHHRNIRTQMIDSCQVKWMVPGFLPSLNNMEGFLWNSDPLEV